MSPSTTIRDALQQTAATLAARADLRDKARMDAQQLLEIATGLTRVQQLASPERPLDAAQIARLQSLVNRRLRAEPVQHLRGSQEFYGREFLVSPDVLIPRPETEDIVTAVLETVWDREAPLRIADVGTGSGALAITLALELPRARVTALDLSPAALTVARRNAEALGASARVRFVQSDLFAAMDVDERFNIIVSNPPYIPLGEAADLHAEVREYEPHLALFAGEDGHEVYRRLLPQARQHLLPGGLLVLETAGRVDLLLQWLADWSDSHARYDLQGIARLLVARRD